MREILSTRNISQEQYKHGYCNPFIVPRPGDPGPWPGVVHRGSLSPTERGLGENYSRRRYIEWRNGIQSKTLSSFCQRLGIEEVKFHDLRATFITNMLA